LEDRLKYILSSVIDWLKFGEAKNAALVALNGAAILSLIGAIKDIGNPAISYFLVHLTIPGLLIGLGISLNAIRGIMSKSYNPNLNFTDETDHILFYGDIAKYSDTEYLKKLYAFHKEEVPEVYGTLEIEFACQIIINARIASRKFKLFNYGLMVTIVAIAGSFLFAILPYYFKPVLSFYTDILGLGIEKYGK
jgi:hypothetical protein